MISQPLKGFKLYIGYLAKSYSNLSNMLSIFQPTLALSHNPLQTDDIHPV